MTLTFLHENVSLHAREKHFYTKFEVSVPFCSGLVDPNETDRRTDSTIQYLPPPPHRQGRKISFYFVCQEMVGQTHRTPYM